MTASPRSDDDLRRFARRTWCVIAAAVSVFLVWHLANVLLLAFAATVVAVLLRSFSEPISRHTPLGEGLSLLVAIILIIAILGLSGWLFGSTVSTQVQDLLRQLPKSPEDAQRLLARLPFGQDIAAQLTDVGGLVERMGSMAGRVGGYALNTVSAVTNLVLVLVAGVFIAAKPTQMREGLLLLAPPSVEDSARATLNNIWRALQLWLLGTFADMVVVGVLTGIGTALIGLPSPFALGLFAGLAAFVPIVGPIVSVVPAALIALQQSPEMVLWAVLVYIAVQQIESNLIFPFIQSRSVGLAPTMTLFGVFGFGVLLGPLGVMFATPLLVAITVAVKRLYVRDALGKTVKIPGADD